MSLERWTKTSSSDGISAGPVVIILLTLLIALIPAIIIVDLMRSGVTIKQIATGDAGPYGMVVVGIVGTGTLIMTVMWLIFPWLAWSLLSKIHNDLIKIERNTRARRSEITSGRQETPM